MLKLDEVNKNMILNNTVTKYAKYDSKQLIDLCHIVG